MGDLVLIGIVICIGALALYLSDNSEKDKTFKANNSYNSFDGFSFKNKSSYFEDNDDE